MKAALSQGMVVKGSKRLLKNLPFEGRCRANARRRGGGRA